MSRFVAFAFLLLFAGLRGPASAAPADGIPARPVPFKFVNDQANLLSAADAKKLEGGLRRYADNTGTQLVVVTVSSLNGASAADYGRQLGTAWGVGQRGKNNGLVVLIGAQEHKVAIEAGSGLRSVITPEVTSRVINQQMVPSFKQGNYFAGLRAGLNTLMLAANPSSNPQKQSAGTATAPAAAATGAAGANLTDNAPTTTEPVGAIQTPEPASSGPGMGTLLIGALVVGGILWLVVRMFRRNSANNNNAAGRPASGTATPNFYPNQPNGPTGNFGGQGPTNYGGMVPNQGGGGMGMGGMLATGAAAAAGAYLGNRMASGHETGTGAPRSFDANTAGAGTGAAGAAAGTGAAGDYFASRDGNSGNSNSAPDYFSGNDAAGNDSSGDYFSADDNTSYDDTSSDDTGGGGFDSSDDNSGSW